jgi:hypothetical protein
VDVGVDSVRGLGVHLQARNTQMFGECGLCRIRSYLAQELKIKFSFMVSVCVSGV